MAPDNEAESERIALLDEIDAAFADVTRENGTSWSESVVVDDYGTHAEQLEARALDHDTHWNQLVDDPKWNPDMGIGGWNFIDAIGTRYYLPAGMKRAIRDGHGESLEFCLTVRGDKFDKFKLGKLSLLNERQNMCVARFIQYMIVVTRAGEEKQYEMYAEPGDPKDGWFDRTRDWEAAFDSHWMKFA